MSSRFLPVFADNATFVATHTLPLLHSRAVGFAAVTDFCTQYRRRGIARFLQSADAALLQQDLQRSGAAFAAYLSWTDPSVVLAGRSAPFFDAAACSDVRAARTIAQRTPVTHKPEYEYEDDFLYMRILMDRFALGRNAADLEPLIGRYEAVLEGAEDARFLICRAFLLRDPQLFDAALERIIAERDDRYSRGIRDETILEEEWATDGKIFVEGLALVRFARALDFPVQTDYLFIPSLAIRPATVTFDAASWTTP
jgi:hypothetical protein